jgi:two-component system, LytTR family, sensor kinase
MPPPPPSARRRALLVVLLFVALGVLYTVQSYFQQLANDAPEPLWLLGRRQLAIWGVRAAFAPAVFRWCDALRARGAGRVGLGAAHVAGALLFGVGAGLVIPLVEWPLGWTPAGMAFARVVRLNLLATTPASVLAYALLALVWYAVAYADDARERAVRAARLESQLSGARLQLLRTQLQPHFLFNTLNTVSGLMADDIRGARVMLSRLAELLRASLDRFDEQEIPLGDEVALARQYVGIQEVRFGDRLDVRFDVVPEAADALVPAFLLQPLVENAIRHGIEARARGGRIAVTGAVDGGELVVAVEDDGPGVARPAAMPNGSGVGLANTRARLRQLYGDAQRLELADAPGGGLRVVVRVPLHLEPVEGAA